MTPYELANLLAPQVREAAERAKPEILASMNPMKRIIVKSIWNMAMLDGIPAINRIIIEFLIAKYRNDLEPMIGSMVNLLLQSIEEEDVSDPRLKLLREIMDTLRTPSSQFHPAVQGSLDPNQPRIVMQYNRDADA